jgi:hypothetical protein
VLTNYPQFIYSLLLADNKLTEFPGAVFSTLRNLKDLDLSSNQLTVLPEEIGQCVKMETLAVLKNRLSALPDSLANCTRMARLEISHNRFTKFPEVHSFLCSHSLCPSNSMAASRTWRPRHYLSPCLDCQCDSRRTRRRRRRLPCASFLVIACQVYSAKTL